MDLIKDENFILIPDSKNRIMKRYLSESWSFSSEPKKIIVERIRKNYVDTIKMINELSKSKGKKYRLPYSDEVLRTYYCSKNEDFRGSFKGAAEWLNEVVEEGYVYRDPERIEFSRNGVRKIDFSSEGATIEVARKEGWFGPYKDWPAKWMINDSSSLPVIRSWDDTNNRFSNIVFRTMDPKYNSYGYRTGLLVAVRLVEVCTPSKKDV